MSIHLSLRDGITLLLDRHYSDLGEEKRLRISKDLLKTAYPELWIGWCNILHNEIEEVLSDALERMKPYTGKMYDEDEWDEIYSLSYKNIWNAVLSGYQKAFIESYIEGTSWGQSIGEAIRGTIDLLASELDIQANF